MMRKILPMLFLIAFSLNVFAQHQVTNDLEAPSVAISVENLTSFTLDAVFTPNDSCAYYNFLLGTEEQMVMSCNFLGGVSIDEAITILCTGNIEGIYTFNYTDLNPNTEYVIYARPFNSDSVAFPMDTIHVTTPNLGGAGLSTVAVEISNITDSSVVMTATPNDQTSVFYDGIITAELFNTIGLDSATKVIQASAYPLYETDVWTWNLDPGTAYKGIAIGKNSNEEWGDTTVVDFMTNEAEAEAPSVEISVENLTPFDLDAVFTPNDSCAYYNFLLGTEEQMVMSCNFLGGVSIDEAVTILCTGNIEGIYTFNYTDLAPNTEYVIYARPFNSDSVAFPMDTIHVTTPNLGGAGLSTVAVEISNITDSSVVMTATPNDHTAMFYDGLIPTEMFNSIGLDSATKIIQSSAYPLYETDVWTWSNLSQGTAYKAMAVGKNSNEEWGDTTIVDFVTLGATGILYTVEDKYQVYPQPNNGTFTFESPYSNGEDLTILDITGKVMYEEKLYDNKHLVNASYLENGVYFLRVGKERSVLRIVINK